MTKPSFAIIESPFAGKTPLERARNDAYTNALMAWAFEQGYAPFASHAIYTRKGVLDDNDPVQRRRGIDAGFKVAEGLALSPFGAIRIFGTDRNWSGGMVEGLEHTAALGPAQMTYKKVSLGSEWSKENDSNWTLLNGELVDIRPQAVEVEEEQAGEADVVPEVLS